MTLAITVASCSGEELKIRPCLVGDKLAFEFDDLHGWLGTRVRPRPSRIELWDLRKSASGILWYVQPDLDKKAKRRSILAYGETISGTTVETPAKPLQVGHAYRVLISGGANSGATDFVYSVGLARCTKLLGD